MKNREKPQGRSAPAMPPRIFAMASPRSVGGVSLFGAPGAVQAATVDGFRSDPDLVRRAVDRLRAAGFEILQITPFTINIAAPRKTYEKAFKTRLKIEPRRVLKSGAVEDMAEFIDCPNDRIPGLIATEGTPFEDVLEGVAIEEPRYFMAPSIFPPPSPYWHLDVPGDVSLGLNADKAHRSGVTGSGIRVAMVDSGWYAHPFFESRGYRAAPVVLGPGASDPECDESGHGTGESANVFAVAPDAELLPVKMSFTNSIAAFNAAVALKPHVITCSWGSSKAEGPLSAADLALAAAVAAAWASGIVVVFSAGNGHFGFPSQHPDCIAAGGVYMNEAEGLRASDYASGFMSRIYEDRRVPDVCGLVGMGPKAIYIMLPIEPGCQIDGSLGGGKFPSGDRTDKDDGWGCFSGTSAAAPQLAGLAALVIKAAPDLAPDDVRDIMKMSARDVADGFCSPSTGGHPAEEGPDLATGDGLADAHKAVLLAKLRGLRAPKGVKREPEAASANPGLAAGPTDGHSGSARLRDAAVSVAAPSPLTEYDIRVFEDMLIKTRAGKT